MYRYRPRTSRRQAKQRRPRARARTFCNRSVIHQAFLSTHIRKAGRKGGKARKLTPVPEQNGQEVYTLSVVPGAGHTSQLVQTSDSTIPHHPARKMGGEGENLGERGRERVELRMRAIYNYRKASYAIQSRPKRGRKIGGHQSKLTLRHKSHAACPFPLPLSFCVPLSLLSHAEPVGTERIRVRGKQIVRQATMTVRPDGN